MFPRLPENVPSWAQDIIVTCIIGPLIATIFVLIRIWTREVVTHNIGLDDFVAVITLLFCISFSVVLGISTRYGMGLHLYDMTPQMVQDHSEWIFISSAMYLPSILGYRLAVLLMYLRLFGCSKPFRYATWAVMAFVTGYLGSNIITLIFGCTPIAKYWKPDLPGHCIQLVQADHAYGSMNVISDVLLFLLPLPMVWQLRLSWKEKLGVLVIFMSGIINCTVTTVRFSLLVENLQAHDTAWLDARTFLLTVVEINTGLICSCTPVLKPFFKSISSMVQSHRREKSTKSLASSIWMGKNPDDQSHSNYRNFIELEKGKDNDHDIYVHEIKR